jgi:hypothetical protein
MNTDALNKLRDARLITSALARKLYSLAEAFEVTGNENVADRLGNLASDAEHAYSLIEAGTDEALTSALTATEQATANMIMAAVAVADAR